MIKLRDSYTYFTDSIFAEYPYIESIKVKVEDDGRVEVKFKIDGFKYEAKLDSANNIIEVEEKD